MKNVSKAILACLVLSATFMTSCDKEVTTSPLTVDLSKTATLQMFVYADLDLTNYGKELVPTGTKVILTIANSDLNPSATGNWIDTVATDAQGKILASVPTNAKGVTVTISPVDFVADQVQSLTASNATIAKVFKKTGTAQTVSLKTADVKIQLVEYDSATPFSDFDNYVTISGKAYAGTDNNNSVVENSPLVDVIFSGTGWSKKITLVKTGAYTTFTIQVPNSLSISYSFDFSSDKNISDGGTGWVKKLYRYNGTNALTTYTGNTEGVVLNFGEGTLVD